MERNHRMGISIVIPDSGGHLPPPYTNGSPDADQCPPPRLEISPRRSRSGESLNSWSENSEDHLDLAHEPLEFSDETVRRRRLTRGCIISSEQEVARRFFERAKGCRIPTERDTKKIPEIVVTTTAVSPTESAIDTPIERANPRTVEIKLESPTGKDQQTSGASSAPTQAKKFSDVVTVDLVPVRLGIKHSPEEIDILQDLGRELERQLETLKDQAEEARLLQEQQAACLARQSELGLKLSLTDIGATLSKIQITQAQLEEDLRHVERELEGVRPPFRDTLNAETTIHQERDITASKARLNGDKDDLGYYARRSSEMLDRGSEDYNKQAFGHVAVAEHYNSSHSAYIPAHQLRDIRHPHAGKAPSTQKSDLLVQFRYPTSISERPKTSVACDVSTTPIQSSGTWGFSDLLVQFKCPSGMDMTPPVAKTQKTPFNSPNSQTSDMLTARTGYGNKMPKWCNCYASPIPKALQSHSTRKARSRPVKVDNDHLKFLNPLKMGLKFSGTKLELEDMMQWEDGKFAEVENPSQPQPVHKGSELGIVYVMESSEAVKPRKRNSIVSIEEVVPPHSRPNMAKSSKICDVFKVPEEPVGKSHHLMIHDSKDTETLDCGSWIDDSQGKPNIKQLNASEDVGDNSATEARATKQSDIFVNNGVNDGPEMKSEFAPFYLSQIVINGATYTTETPKRESKYVNFGFSPSSSPARSAASVRFNLPSASSSPYRDVSLECVRGTPGDSPSRVSNAAVDGSSPTTPLRRKNSSISLRGLSSTSILASLKNTFETPRSNKSSPARSDGASPSNHGSIRGSLRKLKTKISGSFGRKSVRRSAMDLLERTQDIEVEKKSVGSSDEYQHEYYTL